MKKYAWFLLFLLMASPVQAEEGASISSEGPIEVTSERMESDLQSGEVHFSGKVIGIRGTMTIYADDLTLFFVEVDGTRNIDHLDAQGHVRVVDGERIAKAQNLTYVQATEIMTLTGNAEVHQGDNQVSGDEIVLFVREDRSLVTSGKDGRVKAVFLPAQAKP